MAFPESVIQDAWRQAGGTCQCRHTAHGHSSRCGHPVWWEHRDDQVNKHGWEAHRIDPDGADTLENCEIVCRRCMKQNRLYGV